METVPKITLLIVSLFMLNTCNAEIKMIQATIRHGDRYPESKKTLLAIYPNDPYFNETWEPYGKMGLAEKGKANAFKMGMFLRNRYDELLGATYDEKEVYFQSTDTSRTITTGRWVAAGLYSDPRPQNLNSTLFPIYIPINVVPYQENILNNAFMLCENYLIDKQISENIVKKQEDFKNLGTLFKYLSAHTGIEHSSCSQSLGLYHNFVAQTNLGLEIEPWVDLVFPYGQLWNMSVIEYKLQSYTDRMKRLTGGIWIRKFLEHINNFIEETDDHKAYFYINHEFHTAAILNTLGVYQPHIPSYLSTVIFELHEINNELYVKVIHKNGDVLTELVIPGCQKSLCSLKTFENVLKNVTLDNFEEDCGKRAFFEFLI